MPCTPELLDELNMLIRFDLVTDQQGLKVQTHMADAKVISAARRLFCTTKGWLRSKMAAI
jgi:uncharacterized protein (TIGR02647 family)